MEQLSNSTQHGHRYSFRALRQGKLLWEEDIRNIVVDVGLNEILDKFYKGSSYSAAHYIGLTAASPTFAAADTMSSHAGWTEQAGYSEATRELFVPGSVASQSVNNASSVAEFTISGSNVAIGGAFMSTNNTKSGTSGVLIGGAAFSANRTLQNGDILQVTVTASAAAS